MLTRFIFIKRFRVIMQLHPSSGRQRGYGRISRGLPENGRYRMPFSGQPGPGRPPARPTRLTWLVRTLLGLKLNGVDPDDSEPPASRREAMWRLGTELGLQTHHIERLVNRCFWPSDPTAAKLVVGLREKLRRLGETAPGLAQKSVSAWFPKPTAYRFIKDPASLRKVLGEIAEEDAVWVQEILYGPTGEFVYRPKEGGHPGEHAVAFEGTPPDVLGLRSEEPGMRFGAMEASRSSRAGRRNPTLSEVNSEVSDLRKELGNLIDLVEVARRELRQLERRVETELPSLNERAKVFQRIVEHQTKESKLLEQRIHEASSLKKDLERLREAAGAIIDRFEKHSGRHSDGGAGG